MPNPSKFRHNQLADIFTHTNTHTLTYIYFSTQLVYACAESELKLIIFGCLNIPSIHNLVVNLLCADIAIKRIRT